MKNRMIQSIIFAIMIMFAAVSVHALGIAEASSLGFQATRYSFEELSASTSGNKSLAEMIRAQEKKDIDVYVTTEEITNTLFVRIEEARVSDLAISEMTDEEVVALFIATSATEI